MAERDCSVEIEASALLAERPEARVDGHRAVCVRQNTPDVRVARHLGDRAAHGEVHPAVEPDLAVSVEVATGVGRVHLVDRHVAVFERAVDAERGHRPAIVDERLEVEVKSRRLLGVCGGDRHPRLTGDVDRRRAVDDPSEVHPRRRPFDLHASLAEDLPGDVHGTAVGVGVEREVEVGRGVARQSKRSRQAAAQRLRPVETELLQEPRVPRVGLDDELELLRCVVRRALGPSIHEVYADDIRRAVLALDAAVGGQLDPDARVGVDPGFDGVDVPDEREGPRDRRPRRADPDLDLAVPERLDPPVGLEPFDAEAFEPEELAADEDVFDVDPFDCRVQARPPSVRRS